MTSLLNLIRQIARDEIEKHPVLEIAIVDSVSYRPSGDETYDFECAVRFPSRMTPDGEPLKVENVKIATHHTGFVNPPYIDDMVLVSFINRNFDEPVIIGRLYTKEKPAPVFKHGQYILEFKPEVFQYNEEDADGLWGLGEWETTKDQAEADDYEKFHIRFYLHSSDTSATGKDSEVYGAEMIMDRDRITLKVDQDGTSEIILERSGGSRLTITQEGDIALTAERNIQMYAPGSIQMIAANEITGNATDIAFSADNQLGCTAKTQGNFQSKDVNILASDNIVLAGYEPGKSSDDSSAFSDMVSAFSSFLSSTEDTSAARATGNSQGSGFADLLADALDKGISIISKLLSAGYDQAPVKNIKVNCTSWKADVDSSGPCGVGIFGGDAVWTCDKNFKVVTKKKDIKLTAKKKDILLEAEKNYKLTTKKEHIVVTANKGDSKWEVKKGKFDIVVKKAIEAKSKDDRIKLDGKKSIVLNSHKPIKMYAKKEIDMQSKTNSIALKAKKNIKMKADMQIQAEAKMKASIKAKMGEFKADAMLTLKGGMVKIN